VSEHRVSGEGVAAFCGRHGLAVSTFQSWRRRLTAVGGVGFVELTSTTRPSWDGSGGRSAGRVWPAAGGGPEGCGPPGVGSGLWLGLGRGVAAWVGPGFDAALLREVVEALS
jgi:hypothetical protein